MKGENIVAEPRYKFLGDSFFVGTSESTAPRLHTEKLECCVYEEGPFVVTRDVYFGARGPSRRGDTPGKIGRTPFQDANRECQ